MKKLSKFVSIQYLGVNFLIGFSFPPSFRKLTNRNSKNLFGVYLCDFRFEKLILYFLLNYLVDVFFIKNSRCLSVRSNIIGPLSLVKQNYITKKIKIIRKSLIRKRKLYFFDE